MCDAPLGSNPPNTFWFSCNQIAFKIRSVGREVPPIAANCAPLYQAGKCACRDLSIYKPNLKREPGGVLDIAILAQSKCNAPNVFYHCEMVWYEVLKIGSQ